jgi:hypothetical protein
MSETAATAATTAPVTAAEPAAPTIADQAAALPDPVAPAAETVAQRREAGKKKARDLAGKFMGAGGAAALAAEKGIAPTALGNPKEPLAEAAAEVEAPVVEPVKAKPVVDEAEEKRWKEIRRRQRQAKENAEALKAERAAIAEREKKFAAFDAERVADENLRLTDPPAWLEKHRFDFREVALQEVSKQQLTPEQKAAKSELDAIRAELAKEREERLKLDKESRALIEERKAEKADREQKEALATLHKEAKSEWTASADAHPVLGAYYTPEEISEAATQLRIDHFKKTNREASLDEVFAFMEKNAAREHERFSRQQAQAAVERTERDTVAGKPAKTRAKVGPPVTNQVSATKASPDRALTPDEKRSRAVALAATLLGPRH